MGKLFIITILIVQSLFLYSQKNNEPIVPDGYRSNTTLKLAYVLGTLKLIDKKPEVPKEILKSGDIIYKIIEGDTLRLDIYRHKSVHKSAPLLVFIHGGSWKKGKKDDYRRYLIDFAKKGYITATISYRLSGQAKFPAALNDVNCAIGWLKSNADKYFIDANKVALIGGSAGGHLAMMAGYSSDILEFDTKYKKEGIDNRVQVVVNLYGPSDLTTEVAIESGSVQEFIGQPYSTVPDIYIKASPITYLTKDDPPTLIFHGTIDEIVPVKQSDKLKKDLDKVGVIAEYHKLKGWPHTMDLGIEINEYCQFYMNTFFDKHLKSR